MNHPTDPAVAMREACAKLAHDILSDEGMDTIARIIAKLLRAIPIPAAQPDPRDEALRLAREALEESLSLNKNWSCEAEPETLAYYSEYKAVIRQAEEALAAIDALKE